VLSPLYRGDSREYTLSFVDKNGTAIDITGWKVYFTLKRSIGQNDGSATLKKDIVNHESSIKGKTKIVLTSSDTDDLKPDNYVYDIQVKKPNGDVITVVMGSITIEADVTRRAD